MGNRLSKLYTRTGDSGETGLGDGSRIRKNTARVGAMGDVDELNSLLGMLIAMDIEKELKEVLSNIQHVLFNLGGELSIPGTTLVGASDVERLENLIDKYNSELPPLKEFILPGGSQAAASCHLARAVCRRAERGVIMLADEEAVNPGSQQYLNRLSDLLFVFARLIARNSGTGEVLWQREQD